MTKRPALLIIIAATAATASQIITGHLTSAYDTGVYLEAARHLITGEIPYRDFWYIQPPGSLLPYTPAAVLAHWSPPAALLAARVTGGALLAAAALLATRLVRRSGAGAQLLAGLGTIATPAATYAWAAAKIEAPTLALIFGAANLLLDDRRSTRRNVLAGALIGLSVTIKLWAIFPAAALLATLLLTRRPWRTATATSLAAAAAITTPFVLAAPRTFWTAVVSAQMHRLALKSETIGIITRLEYLNGNTTRGIITAALALLTAAALTRTTAQAIQRKTPDRAVTIFLLSSAALTAAALLFSTESYAYYYLFSAAFIWPAIASSRPPQRTAALPATAALLAASGAVWGTALNVSRGYPLSTSTAITAATPAGACIDAVDLAALYEASRLPPPGCHTFTDNYAQALAPGGGSHVEQPTTRYLEHYEHRLLQAQFIITPTATNITLPMIAPSFRTWLSAHYRPTSSTAPTYTWTRIHPPMATGDQRANTGGQRHSNP